MASKVLVEIQKAKEELQSLMKNQGEAALKEAFVDFFKENPEITAVAWAQYAPHFNDGDACEFSVHEFCASLTKNPNLNEFNGYGDDDEGFLDPYSMAKPLQEAVRKLQNEVADDELFEMIWGNGYKVMATPDGKFRSDDHDHD